MAVTDRRVIVKIGVAARGRSRFFSPKWRALAWKKRSGRMLGYWTRGCPRNGGTPGAFDTVAHPLEFRKQVHNRLRIRRKGRARKNSRYASDSGVQGSSLNLVFRIEASTYRVAAKRQNIEFSSGTRRSRFRAGVPIGLFPETDNGQNQFLHKRQLRLCSLRINAFGRAVKNHAVNAFADGDAVISFPDAESRTTITSLRQPTKRRRVDFITGQSDRHLSEGEGQLVRDCALIGSITSI